MSREVVALDNGARVVLCPMPHLRSASVGVWLAAGARDEPPEWNGLAHFHEHMAFKGAAGRSARQIAEAVEARGAVMNASTDYERTSFYFRCLSDDAASMLDTSLALVLSADYPLDEIEREKGVVLQEIGEARDQPDDLVQELAQAAAFPGHPLGAPILGTEASVASFTRDDLAAFSSRLYQPSRLVVSVAGAFDRNAILDNARGWLEGRTDARPPARNPAVIGTGAKTERRRTEQSHLVFSRPVHAVALCERLAIRLFVEIFGGGMASRLFQQVREERGLVYAIDAGYDQFEDAGRIVVSAGCAPSDAVEVARLTSAIWAQLAADGPTDGEVERARAVAKAQLAMGLETPANQAANAAHELMSFDRLLEPGEILAGVDTVYAADIQAVARACLAGGAVAASVGPAAGEQAAALFAGA